MGSPRRRHKNSVKIDSFRRGLVDTSPKIAKNKPLEVLEIISSHPEGFTINKYENIIMNKERSNQLHLKYQRD